MSAKESETGSVFDKAISRRQAIKLGVATSSALAVSMYVKPAIQNIGPARAQSVGTPTGGCTPGFWKNHREDWPTSGPYQPDNPYTGVFNVGSWTEFDGMSLIQASMLGAGCPEALGRHSTAALLNALTLGEGAFGASVATVIADTNTAFADPKDCVRVLAQKDVWEGLNEASCPLGGRI